MASEIPPEKKSLSEMLNAPGGKPTSAPPSPGKKSLGDSVNHPGGANRDAASFDASLLSLGKMGASSGDDRALLNKKGLRGAPDSDALRPVSDEGAPDKKGAAPGGGLKSLSRKVLEWEDREFASDVVRAETQEPFPVVSWVLYAIAAFFGIAILWASFSYIDQSTRGEGTVIPSSQIQVIQNLEGGIVKSINTHEGDIVEVGQVLMEIDDTAASSSLGELRAKRYGMEAKVARLTAEVQGTPLVFPPRLLAEARAAAAAEENLMRARDEALQVQVDILRQQAGQREQELAELKTKIEQSQISLGLAQQELDMTLPLANRGVVPKVQLLRIQRDVAAMAGDIANNQAMIPRTESAIQEANQRVAEKLGSFRADAGKELVEAQTQLAAFDETLKGATDKLDRTEVRSPVRGVVKTLNVSTIGGVVKPGMDLVEIVPLDDTLLVEAKITPKDVAFLKPGQEAKVTFTAYDSSIYGGLTGRLERISADAIVDPNQKNATTYFKIIVRTDKNHLERYGEVLPIMPGMVASVDILTGKRTILEYLLKPLRKSQERALRER